ncbi:MAG TPA: APC family permease [Candidatus Bathyarchaeia archaeon]|nr:APC family permease [Candidatus Bathyarchaeia archaeon]
MQIFSGVCCIIPFYSGFGDSVGNYWLAVAIALITALLVLSVFAHFSAAMPRSGGDYIFIGRTMNPLLGFAPNFSFYCIEIVWNALNIAFFVSLVPLLASTFMSQQALAPLSTTWGMLGLGMVFWCIGLVQLTGMKTLLRMQAVTWIITFAALGVTGAFMLNAVGVFPALFNKWALQYVPTQPDMYHSIINQGVAAGFNPNPSPEGPLMPATLAFTVTMLGEMIPFMAGIIWVAGEVKKAESGVRQHVIVFVAAIAGMFVFVASSLPWILSAGNQFTGAFVALGGNVNGLPTDGYLWGIFPAVMPSWAVAFYALAAILCDIIVYWVGTTVMSRCMFAWSFDRLFPSFFADVNARFKTPVKALLTAYLLALAVFLLTLVAPNVYTLFGALFFFPLINVFIVCACGLVFPYVRKDLYEQMPLKAKIGRVPVLSIISLLSLILVTWSASSYATNTSFLAAFGITDTMIVFGASFWVVGIVIFFVSRAYNKRRGIDLSIAFKQIPPA